MNIRESPRLRICCSERDELVCSEDVVEKASLEKVSMGLADFKKGSGHFCGGENRWQD